MTEVNKQRFYKKLAVTGLAFTLVGAGTLGLHSLNFTGEPTVASAAAETYTTTANLIIFEAAHRRPTRLLQRSNKARS